MLFKFLDASTPFENELDAVGRGIQKIMITPGHLDTGNRQIPDTMLLNGCVLCELGNFRFLDLRQVSCEDVLDWGALRNEVGFTIFRDAIDDMSNPNLTRDMFEKCSTIIEVQQVVLQERGGGVIITLNDIMKALNLAFVNSIMTRFDGVCHPDMPVTVIPISQVNFYYPKLRELWFQLLEQACGERPDYLDQLPESIHRTDREGGLNPGVLAPDPALQYSAIQEKSLAVLERTLLAAI